MKPNDQSETVTVALGILSASEFASIPDQYKADVEDGSRELLERYGPDWLRRERDRLRYELRAFWDARLEKENLD